MSEAYKCINGPNPKYLNDLFTIKRYTEDLRDGSVTNRNKLKQLTTVLDIIKTVSLDGCITGCI